MEYYSAIKKMEIMSFAATWMDLEVGVFGNPFASAQDSHV